MQATATRRDPQSESQRKLIHLGIDIPLLVVSVTLILFGLVMVYSASTDFSFQVYGNIYAVFLRQLLALAVALLIAAVAFVIDYHAWPKYVVPMMVFVIGLLLLVLFISEERLGARRGLFSGSFQPSELAKFVVVIYVAVWLNSKKDYLQDIQLGLVPLGIILGVMCALIGLQPDYSAVLTILIIGGTMFFLAGGDLKQITLLSLIVVVIGILIVLFTTTGKARIFGFVTGLFDPLSAPYQVRRSMEAFYKGGWLGVGIGNGVAKTTGLPVPQTDSIFAVIGEELGLFGSLVLILLYLVLLWRGLRIARRAPDELGSLLAAGMSFWLVMEAVINMAGMVNLLPFTGNALPFISAGGSNLVVSLTAVGILMNISMRSSHSKEGDESFFSKVIDLRRGNGRRRVPRPRRAASPAQQAEK